MKSILIKKIRLSDYFNLRELGIQVKFTVTKCAQLKAPEPSETPSEPSYSPRRGHPKRYVSLSTLIPYIFLKDRKN